MAGLSFLLPRRYRPDVQNLIYWAVLGLVLAFVLYPIVLIFLKTFQIEIPGEKTVWSLNAWREALSDPVLLSAIWNTITVTVARQAIAFPVAVLIAWILARTDIPGSQWLEFMFWVAFFLPALPVTLGWIMLLDPQYGLINRLITWLPFVDKGPFNIYSFWGIVWAHLGHSTIAIKVVMMVPAFRNMDASQEEASRVCGASSLDTLRRIVVPIMTPVLVVSLLLSIIHSLQAFEVELILGLPIRFFVFSTQIYQLLHQEPPLFPEAAALSSTILGLMVPLIVMQRWATTRRRYTTVSGHFKQNKLGLRRWRLPVCFLVLGLIMLITVVPLFFLTVAAFMQLFGFFNLAQPWTTVHWSFVFKDPIFLHSVWNTLLLAGSSALVAVLVFTFTAYIIVRTRFAGRSILDFVSWLPVTIPGIILGLGLLWLFLETAILRSLYGTIIILVVATVISSMPLGVQIIKANFSQLSSELEEASRVSGGTWWNTLRHIILPIITPTLLLVGTVTFISAARNVSTVALLSTNATRPLSLLQLDFMVEGRYESAAVVGVLVVLLTTGVALAVRLLGLRIGLARGRP